MIAGNYAGSISSTRLASPPFSYCQVTYSDRFSWSPGFMASRASKCSKQLTKKGVRSTLSAELISPHFPLYKYLFLD